MARKILRKHPPTRWFFKINNKVQNSLAKRFVIKNWEKNGRPIPPPPAFKQKTIRKLAKNYKIKIFIETGTYRGSTVDALKKDFKKIYSTELDEKLFQQAQDKFSKYKHIKIIHGDSGEKIPNILKSIREPCLFWLDAHFSGGITAKGNLETPIMSELNHIVKHEIDQHVILIDDARCFNGQYDYPTIEELKEFVMKYLPESVFEIKDDIIRIYNQRTKM